MPSTAISRPRLPAEWEPQDAVLLAWPHPNSDWEEILEEATATYLEIVRQIRRFETVVIIAPDTASVRRQLQQATIDETRIQLIEMATNDTWIRDFGPVTLYHRGKPWWLDFGFNGWGLKFPANFDNAVTRKLLTDRRFRHCCHRTPGLILEGGSIESDGKGTLLTTSNCLLESNRNPHLTRKQLETRLTKLFGLEQILWLDHGWLAGDDTDAHVDTLARLCPDDTILYIRCDDNQDEHYAALVRMEEQLATFKTPAGSSYRLLPLPWPQPQYHNGHRLPATYANFLIINDAVLVPTYGDAADAQALNVIATAFPGRDIIGLDCRSLIKQHGSLHCVTMQLPAGVL